MLMLQDVEVDEDFEDEAEHQLMELDHDQITVDSVYSGEFLDDIKYLAKSYIKQFFINKEMHCGGRIQDCHLLTERNVLTVLNTNMETAIDRSYIAIERSGCFQEKENGLSRDILLVKDILQSCAKAKIPKEFGGGMLLLYLEFCEGIIA